MLSAGKPEREKFIAVYFQSNENVHEETPIVIANQDLTSRLFPFCFVFLN